MKNYFAIVSILLLLTNYLGGQSSTIEVTPDFNGKGTDYLTDVIDFDLPSHPIEFVGLSCFHFDVDNEELSLQYRLFDTGQWSSWIQFEQQDEFVDSERSAYTTKPITIPFSKIQMKSNQRLDSQLTLRLFIAPDVPQAIQVIPRAADCELPEACYRECWCPTCPIDDSPELTVPTHLIIHHSAGNNESNNFTSVVESIWDLHVNTNGWDDIGYNWLIDPNGVLYEGRPDGYQGAHFSCINENTVGICVIGDYTSVQPNEEALLTLVNVLAYEATEHEIDVIADSYHETGDFILDNIAGHRDSSGSLNACSGTECPGESFYPILGDIRLQVSELPCYAGISNIQEESSLFDLKIYPNPFTESLSLTTGNSLSQTFQVYDIQGQLVGSLKSNVMNNVSHLKPGVYFVFQNGKLLSKTLKSDE